MIRREIPILFLITLAGFGIVRSSVCGKCQVEPFPSFQNKRISVGVLWTKTLNSRAECAALCNRFMVIRSFGYKDSSGECVAYTVPLPPPPRTLYLSDSGFNMYSTCPWPQENSFGSCVSSSDCTGAETTCNDGQCVCNMMHVYSRGNCVQGCSAYGSGFTTFKNKNLAGYNDKVVDSVSSIEACMSLCIAETDFLCITADYGFDNHRCMLSSSAWYDVPSSNTASSTSFHQLIRNCA